MTDPMATLHEVGTPGALRIQLSRCSSVGINGLKFFLAIVKI